MERRWSVPFICCSGCCLWSPAHSGVPVPSWLSPALKSLVEVFGHRVVGQQNLWVIWAGAAKLFPLVSLLQVAGQTSQRLRNLKAPVLLTHHLLESVRGTVKQFKCFAFAKRQIIIGCSERILLSVLTEPWLYEAWEAGCNQQGWKSFRPGNRVLTLMSLGSYPARTEAALEDTDPASSDSSETSFPTLRNDTKHYTWIFQNHNVHSFAF